MSNDETPAGLIRDIGVREVAAIATDDPFVRAVIVPGLAVVFGNRTEHLR